MKSLKYLEARSEQTLLEAIAELREAEGADNDAAENIAPELMSDIELHDVIHTVFACPTDLRGEILAHIWSVFGTTLKTKDMHRVNMHSDHKAVLKKIGHSRLLRTWLSNIPNMASIIWRSSRMRSKWPAYDFEPYLYTSLKQIRTEFGIKTIRTDYADNTSGGAALRTIRMNAK